MLYLEGSARSSAGESVRQSPQSALASFSSRAASLRRGVRAAAGPVSGSSALFRKRHELVILAVRDRVVLVRVALGAADRQAEPGGAGGGHPIDVL